MSGNPVPQIFSASRRAVVTARALAMQARADEGPFLVAHMAEEIVDRLDFVRHAPGRSLIAGPRVGGLAERLEADGGQVTVEPSLDHEAPFPRPSGSDGYDFIASISSLETINDLPGGLVHMHRALAPGGLAIATMIGAPSLANLRRAMLAADGERAAARMHPMVDVRAAAELVQRAGWDSPVVDSHTLRVSYTSLDRLVADLRLHGLTSVLRTEAPPVPRAGLERARAAFLETADEDGRVVEAFEILTLSGWRK